MHMDIKIMGCGPFLMQPHCFDIYNIDKQLWFRFSEGPHPVLCCKLIIHSELSPVQ